MSKPKLERAFVALLDRLKPRAEFLILFRAEVLDVWGGRLWCARSGSG